MASNSESGFIPNPLTPERLFLPISTEAGFQEIAVLGDAAPNSLSPESETRWLELAAHNVDHVLLSEAGALSDFIEATTVFPRKAYDVGRDFWGCLRGGGHSVC